MRRKSRLKSCPFCGETPLLKSVEAWKNGDFHKQYSVVCANQKCKAYNVSEEKCGTINRAVKLWNARAMDKRGVPRVTAITPHDKHKYGICQCPVCETGEHLVWTWQKYGAIKRQCVACVNCYSCGPERMLKRHAAGVWNRACDRYKIARAREKNRRAYRVEN